jgi:hypothetical protein
MNAAARRTTMCDGARTSMLAFAGIVVLVIALWPSGSVSAAPSDRHEARLIVSSPDTRAIRAGGGPLLAGGERGSLDAGPVVAMPTQRTLPAQMRSGELARRDDARLVTPVRTAQIVVGPLGDIGSQVVGRSVGPDVGKMASAVPLTGVLAQPYEPSVGWLKIVLSLGLAIVWIASRRT